ncbi:3-oxo-tetronate kinase [Salmonella enterica]|uniref:3-oxo-tetronate kinase n=1 Tax=Salmonella enterica TaxID=28901 RepID=UPI00070D2B7C|nr:four-carbon acid sugar kinase family protein [Salmonella enterica]OIN15363.1 hypothetical protein AO411_2022785 [Salmonella enterica subsp. enterica serovar Sarajane]EBR1021028.1 four-carbon acid sugar kinase family protein [Salmonella enterica]ECO2438921.1 four-carbon acid sugar kinase family protein [Salmonella enterica]EGL7634254.1 four-carbon acid sugar kinase family protein [Salmonella enterica]
MMLGIIADDFTGATDIASFLVENGLSTVQLNGIPENDTFIEAQALVISLKSRSCPPEEAVALSLQALTWLQKQGCTQFYFKYCSTFDSTTQGNIGPVTDALLAALDEKLTVISPALPVNGRTVYQGYLFVMGQLLSDSGMRNHPITPMTDSYLPRLMEAQASGRCAVINSDTINLGAGAVKERLEQLAGQGINYAVLDTLNEQHLLTQGEALKYMKLITGGSGLAIGLARQWAKIGEKNATAAGKPQGQKAVVLSGSCSAMTNKQVTCYRHQAPSQPIDINRCLNHDERARYAEELSSWVESSSCGDLAPLLYATAEPDVLKKNQQQYGNQASSHAIEALFSDVAARLQQRGFQRFIIAGGETSGVVTQTLDIKAFHIGPCISPGVPWVRAINLPISLALKSGNFGDEDFFARAQKEFPI